MTLAIGDTHHVAAATSSFIGRSAELSTLLATARGEDDTSLWLVAGDAGVGKTRLVEEVMAGLAADRATVGRGSCLQTAQGALPFVAVAEALTAVCRASDPDRVHRLADALPELGLLLPELAPVAPQVTLPGAPNGRADVTGDDASRLRLFDAISRLLAELSAERPICLVLEDLHWAEPSTRDLLPFLLAHLADRPVTIIGTYRSDAISRTHPLRPLLAELDRRPRVGRLPLAPFDLAELTAFADARLGTLPTARVLDEVAERSGGNAFYASELLDAHAAGRQTVRRELFDLILARIEPLSTDAKETLDLLAAGGGAVRDDLLAAVTQKDEDTLDAALHEAIEHQVVVVGDDGTLRFRHALMQEAVYSTLLPRQRRRKHERYAAVLSDQPRLAASPESEAAELAWHLAEARRFDEAFAASLLAADAAERILAFSEALEHIESALELWDEARRVDGPPPTHLDLLVRAGSLAAASGNAPRAVTFQRAALREADDLPATRQAVMHTTLGRYLQSAGMADHALEEYRTGVELVPSTDVTAERAEVLAGLGGQLMLTMHHGDAEPVLAAAIDVARRCDARTTLGHALNSLGCVLLHQGHCEEGIAHLTEARDIAEELGSVSAIARYHVNLGSGLTLQGDLREAERVGREGIEFLDASGHPPVQRFYIASNLCETLCEMGRIDEAWELARSAPRPEGILPTTWTLHYSLLSALRQGDLEEAQRIVDAFEADTLAANDPQALYAFWNGVAQLATAMGDASRARNAIARGLPASHYVAHHLEMRSLAITLEARDADRGVDGAAERAADELALMEAELAATIGTPDRQSFRIRALLAQARARVAQAGRGDPTDQWRAAVDEWDGGGFAWNRADAQHHLGAALLRAGDRTGAARELVAVAEFAEQFGATPLGEATRALLDNAGLLAAASDGNDDAAADNDARHGPLTAREFAVLQLIADGRTNRQIGEQLYISPKTASVHVSRILQKLNVENRTEAAAAGRRAGLVS